MPSKSELTADLDKLRDQLSEYAKARAEQASKLKEQQEEISHLRGRAPEANSLHVELVRLQGADDRAEYLSRELAKCNSEIARLERKLANRDGKLEKSERRYKRLLKQSGPARQKTKPTRRSSAASRRPRSNR